jgi:hypothetical protein
MVDLTAISHRITAAIKDAESHGATLAAEVLQRDVPALQLQARRGPRCDDCEFHPSPTIGATTDRIQSHG